MKQVFKLYYDFNKTQLRIIEELSYHTTKLYNIVNYDMRPLNYKSYKVNEKNYKSNFHSQYLTAHNYQQCLKVLDQNWKGFFAARDEHKKHPEKVYRQTRTTGF